MTTLAQYVFPSAALLSGVVVRAYATGRYCNNSVQTAPSISTAYNGVAQCVEASIIPASAIAQAFTIWAHFYFTVADPNAGQAVAVGSNLQVSFSNAFATSTITGAFVPTPRFQMLSNPAIILVNTALQTTLTLTFAPVGGDNLEVHAGYMEAL